VDDILVLKIAKETSKKSNPMILICSIDDMN